jgi:hypothetical protein
MIRVRVSAVDKVSNRPHDTADARTRNWLANEPGPVPGFLLS